MGVGHISSHCVVSFVLEVLDNLLLNALSFNKLDFQHSPIAVSSTLTKLLVIFF